MGSQALLSGSPEARVLLYFLQPQVRHVCSGSKGVFFTMPRPHGF
uniref:Uncharacterized protein n=1 Tax=Anguilla anguilla TaxID=7936 RepID=A0A0E9VK22_ANGAN